MATVMRRCVASTVWRCLSTMVWRCDMASAARVVGLFVTEGDVPLRCELLQQHLEREPITGGE